MERVMTLLGSARANKQEAYENIYRYEGAIMVLEAMRDDLRTQEIVEAANAMGEPELDEVTPGSNGSAEVQPADRITEAG